MILYFIIYIVASSIIFMVGFFIGARVAEKKYDGGEPTPYGFNTYLTIDEQCEQALDECKKILNEKK